MVEKEGIKRIKRIKGWLFHTPVERPRMAFTRVKIGVTKSFYPPSSFYLLFAADAMSMNLHSYQNLIVWKEADDLCVFTHEVTKKFPTSEESGLVSQMRRSSSSVPTNIVEGNSRKTVPDKKHFMIIARSSLHELHYQYHLAFRLQYINENTFTVADNHMKRVGYLLMRFMQALVAEKA